MKKFNFTFYLIKVIVLLLINLMCFTVSLILHLIFKPAGNPGITAIISSAAGGALFLAYTYKTAASLKNPDNLTPARFAAREGICYAVFMLIPLVLTLILGVDKISGYIVMLFMLPNTFFFYLTSNAFIGYFIHIVLYTAVVTASIFLSKKKTDIAAPDDTHEGQSDDNESDENSDDVSGE